MTPQDRRTAVAEAVLDNWPNSSIDVRTWHPDDQWVMRDPANYHLTNSQRKRIIEQQRKQRMVDAIMKGIAE